MANSTLQVCTRCGVEQPLDSSFFRPHNEKRKDGSIYSKLKRICRACELKASILYRATPKAKEAIRQGQKRRYHENKNYHRNIRLRTIYGITIEDYNYLLEKQGYHCAICHTDTPTNKRGNIQNFSVDHCHTTGKVRGLLCSKCNIAIGLLQDSSIVAQRATNYLKEHNK